MVIRMQVNGVGNSYDSYSHQVTDCIHDHADGKKQNQGGTRTGDSSVVSLTREQKQSTGSSLTGWISNLLGKGQSVLRGIWGTGNTSNAGSVLTQMEGEEQRAPFVPVPVPGQDMPVSPFQKIRIRVQQITKQLAGHLPGHFFGSSGGNSLQTKQEGTGQDLRRRSQYKDDDMEIECILTDESYLMDSYNRKGEYSRLSTGNKK